MLRPMFVLALALPAVLAAQGRVIAPCDRPVVVDCGPGRCAPTQVPCGPTLVRTLSQARVALKDRVLHYEVTEIFVNRGSTVAEADYLYPLPPGAAFEDLKLSINGELVSGETMSADRARGIYEEIVRRQRDPALVEWMGSGLLRARIFPIQPGEEKKVVVRFQSVAQREGDALRISYRRGSDPSRRAPSARPTEEDDDWTSFSLLYEPGTTYGAPYSPTHSLRTRDEHDGRTRLVEARGVGRDVTVLIPLRRAEAASLSLLTHRTVGEKGFALLTITPPVVQRSAVPRDITFIVDVSGSMRGQKLQQAKEAGYALLATLRAEDRFKIIDFSTDVRSFRNGFVPATPDQLRDARLYLRDLKAEGSTNISGALEEAFRTATDGERLPLVVFITDGEPTVGERSPDRIADMAAQRRGSARVFSIGVSADVNANLIEQLAVRGGGLAHFVRDDESVEHTTSLLARRLSSPVLTDVRIEVDGIQLSQILPSGSIDLFAGQDVVVLARYQGSGSAVVRLQGRSSTGAVTWSTRANFAESAPENGFIPRLWAAQRIGWLAAEKRQNGGNGELNAEIKLLGERYGIPTEYSSYLVVEPGTTVGSSGAVRTDAGFAARSTSPSTGAPTSAPMARGTSANEMSFESARDAAEKRSLRSISEIKEAPQGEVARFVSNRSFTKVSGVWTDSRYASHLSVVRVKPYSNAYFALIGKIPELAEIFALGDRVLAAGRGVAVELAANGQDAITPQELMRFTSNW